MSRNKNNNPCKEEMTKSAENIALLMALEIEEHNPESITYSMSGLRWSPAFIEKILKDAGLSKEAELMETAQLEDLDQADKALDDTFNITRAFATVFQAGRIAERHNLS